MVSGYTLRMAVDIKSAHKMKSVLEMERRARFCEREASTRGSKQATLTNQVCRMRSDQVVTERAMPYA